MSIARRVCFGGSTSGFISGFMIFLLFFAAGYQITSLHSFLQANPNFHPSGSTAEEHK